MKKRKTFQFFLKLADLSGIPAEQMHYQLIDGKPCIVFDNEENHPVTLAEFEDLPGCYRVTAIMVPDHLLKPVLKALRRIKAPKQVKTKTTKVELREPSGMQMQILRHKKDGNTDDETAVKVHRSPCSAPAARTHV
jgi:hypothetical protein